MTNRLLTLDCISFGVPFRLCAESPLLLEKMQQCVPFGSELGDGSVGDGKRFYLKHSGRDMMCSLLIDDEIAAEDAELQPVLDRLASDLMVHVAECAASRVFVHAGVVGWQGSAIVLPGKSFAGKTTLVAELVRCGATYYSDEYAVFDERGRVHPYPRDLQVRENGAATQRAVSVAQLNGSTGIEALPVSQVVFAEYVDGGCWKAEPVSCGMAALEMMRHAIPVQRAPVRVMATLAKVMEAASAVRSTRGEASATAQMLLAAMECGASL